MKWPWFIVRCCHSIWENELEENHETEKLTYTSGIRLQIFGM
jgi:hypothetical protein